MMNATFTVDDVDFDTIAEYFEHGIDVIPITLIVDQGPVPVYPMTMSSVFIIVPEALPYSDFLAFLRSLTSKALFGYFSGAIIATILSLSAFRYVERKTFLFLQSAADVVNLLLNDNGYINYRRLSRAEVFVVGPLTFVGFIMVNGILSNLQSYVTQPVLQPQIRTFDDLYSSSLNITIPSEYWRNRLLETATNQSKYQDWNDKISVMEYQQLFKQVQLFDISTAYLLGGSDVYALQKIQKLLGIRGYFNTEIQIANLLNLYPINENFLFFEKLNEIILRIHGAGLYVVWVRDLFAESENRIVVSNRERLEYQQVISDVETFEFPMLIVYGWIAGSVVLVVEIVFQRFQRNDFSA